MAIIGPKQYPFDLNSGTFNDTDSNGNLIMFPYDISEMPNNIDNQSDFHINSLKNKFKDVARPNLFKVKIIPPAPLMKDWDASKSGLLALAKRTSLPQISIKEWVYERAGQKLHIPTNEVDYGECSITFINDSDFALRTLFNRWQRLTLFNWEKNLGAVPLLALSGEVTIFQYDSQLKPIYAINLTNAWPQTLSNIELNQDSENIAEEFTVDFKFTMQQIYKNSGE